MNKRPWDSGGGVWERRVGLGLWAQADTLCFLAYLIQNLWVPRNFFFFPCVNVLWWVASQPKKTISECDQPQPLWLAWCTREGGGLADKTVVDVEMMKIEER
jgi:hypothetical protein